MDLERQALQTALRAFAWILGLAAVLPFDFTGADPVWPWHGLMDAGPADAIGLLLPLFGAGWFAWLGRRDWSKLQLSLAMGATLLIGWGLAGLAGLGPHPLGVFDQLTDGLPALFSRSFWVLLLGGALLAGGLRLSGRGFLDRRVGRPALADPWPVGRVLIGTGIGLTVLFYLLPYRGLIPLTDLLAGIAELVPALDSVEGAALLSGHVLSIGPLIFALAAGVRLVRRPVGAGGALAGFAAAFVPGLCLLVGLRNLPSVPASTLIHLRSAALLLTLTAGGGLALAALVRALWYEVPWTFGRLSLADDLLAAALSDPDPDGSLRRSLGQLHPLVRTFVRRRLVLWRLAAAEVPGAGQADLSEVIRFLERRWGEEQAGRRALADLGVSSGRDPSDGDAPTGQQQAWPGWTRGPWLSLGLVLVVVCGLLLVWGLGRRPDQGQIWSLGPDSPGLAEVFVDRLPGVAVDLARSQDRYQDRAAYKNLQHALADEEGRVAGLTDAVDDLISLGHAGRYRLHRVRRARDRLNRLLMAHQVPYYVRSWVRVGPTTADDRFTLLTYRIRACRLYRIRGADDALAVLLLSRADRLNLVEGYVGMTEQEETFVAVLIDRLGFFMGARLAEVLERPDVLGQIAAEAAEQLGGGPDPSVDQPAGFDSPLGQQLADGLVRHELHHRWLGLEPEPPTALWAFLMDYQADLVSAVTAEVGAFLGELRYRPAYARLRLALMIDGLQRPAGRRGSYGLARAYLVHRLLDVDLGPNGLPDWAGLGQAVQSLSMLEDGDLVERIDAVHADLFGQPAPVFERIDKS